MRIFSLRAIGYIRWLFVVLAEIVEVEIPAVRHVVGEAGEVSPFPLGGASKSFSAVNESADFHYFEQVELFAGSDIFHILRHEARAETVFGECAHAETVCHGRLAHVHYIARPNRARRLGDDVGWRCAESDTSFLAGFGGDGARLEHTYCP